MVGDFFLTHLGSPFILETSRLVHFGSFSFVSVKDGFEKNRVLKIDSRPSPSSLEWIRGSFHGYRFRHCNSDSKLGFSVFPDLLFSVVTARACVRACACAV